jgi:hypothetical protein
MDNPVSKDDEAKVLEALTQLSLLRETDAKGFQTAMNALGFNDDVDLSTFDINALTKQLRGSQPSTESSMENLRMPKTDESIDITPIPGFTVKTKRQDDMKVFINLCTHTSISEPGNKKKLNDDGEEVEGLNIPMSVGIGRNDVDHSGSTCVVHDVIVNPTVLQESIDDVTGKYKDFICHLLLQCLEQKFQYTLDTKYKLPNIKYKGAIESQRIQDRKNMPSIVEIASKTEPTKPSNKKPLQAVPVPSSIELTPSIQFQWCFHSGQIQEVIGLEITSVYTDPIHVVDVAIKSIRMKLTFPSFAVETDIASSLDIQASAFKFKVGSVWFISACILLVLTSYIYSVNVWDIKTSCCVSPSAYSHKLSLA